MARTTDKQPTESRTPFESSQLEILTVSLIPERFPIWSAHTHCSDRLRAQSASECIPVAIPNVLAGTSGWYGACADASVRRCQLNMARFDLQATAFRCRIPDSHGSDVGHLSPGPGKILWFPEQSHIILAVKVHFREPGASLCPFLNE